MWSLSLRSKPSNLSGQHGPDLGLRDHVLLEPNILPDFLQQSTDECNGLDDLDLDGYAASLGILLDIPVLLEVERH